jgi:spore germination protein GerM
MQNDKQNRRFPLGLLAGILAGVLAVGGGAAWWAKYSLQQANQSSTEVKPETEVKPTPPPQKQEATVEICWLNPTAERIELVSSTLSFEKSVQPSQILETAFKDLLAGPKTKAYTTTIPEGTKLLGLKTDDQGIHVNLSQDFTSGGGSTSMTGRLAQVIYTATSLNPQGNVWIEVEGKPIEHLGGEGLIINQPMTRQDFNDNFTLDPSKNQR